MTNCQIVISLILMEPSSKRLAFKLELAFSSQNVNAYTLVAKTEDDKRKWVSAIQEALNNVFPTPR